MLLFVLCLSSDQCEFMVLFFGFNLWSVAIVFNLLGAFTKLPKGLLALSCRSFDLSICMHATILLPFDVFT